jgi:hypothetical protein
MEQEMKEQKEKEKSASKLADLARYKLRGVAEGGTSFLGTVLEIDDLESSATMRMKRRAVQDIEDPSEKRLRQQALSAERRLVQKREDRERLEKEKEEKEKEAREEDKDNSSTIYNKERGDMS